ncbi:alpha-L-fucosidase [Coraliomargarita parva]|uniref:alpha-L-fucosidase n=1 Tax=Coraliomargarita parva TaxID=3014050 RepID=UPI0022B36FD4|nr:alpha-L-fucosidase [Coraliomargarita parva]
MIRHFAYFALSLLPLAAQTTQAEAKTIWDETSEEKEQRLEWFTDARFGLFIHWGLYSLAGRHEWVMKNESMSVDDYRKYFEHFDPDLYDPKEWARAAKEAGMKYVVITAKHHDGFCLFDSAYTDYKSTQTPYGKDLLKPMVEAFRAEGIRIGIYYSLIDWHHPEFTVDKFHPMSENEAERAKNSERDMSVYREYMRNQVRELLSNYGEIDVLFLDFSYPGEDGKGREDWDSVGLMQLVRELQPQCIVNDRADLLDYAGGWDYRSPEQIKPREWVTMDGKKVPWGTVQTFSGSWGYYRDEHTWKSTKQLLGMLIDTVSKGGNLILNVGPTGRGNFDARANDRFSGIGKWMQVNGRAIYGCTQAPEAFKTPENCILTYNPELNRIYVHVLDWPMGKLWLDGFAGKVAYAQLLHDGSEVQFKGWEEWQQDSAYGNAANTLPLDLPIMQPDVEIPVIELFLK